MSLIFKLMKGIEIAGYPGYSITEDAEVWSYRQLKARKLKPRKTTQNGKYLQVSLYHKNCKVILNKRNHKKKLPDQVYIHRIMWETYKGEIPQGMTVDHIDNNPKNNHISNLQLMTQSQNSTKGNAYCRRDDLWNNRDEVILKCKELGSQRKTAEFYNCSEVTMHRVIHNKRKTTRKGKQVFR